MRSLGQVVRWTRPVRAWYGCVLDAALPQTCVGCGVWTPAEAQLVCAECAAQIEREMFRRYCPRCGRTLPAPAIHAAGCARCRTERHWNVAGIARVGRYGGAMRNIVTGLKYRGVERNAEYLADLLATGIRATGWADDLDALVPVPMHWLRRWQRPCDHARVLTEALGRRLRKPVVRIVRRGRPAPSQTGVSSKTARFENVRGCFDRRAGSWLDVAGQTVCIVDNLMMTGATVAEVAKVVRAADAKRIYAAVAARPASPGDPPIELLSAGEAAEWRAASVEGEVVQ